MWFFEYWVDIIYIFKILNVLLVFKNFYGKIKYLWYLGFIFFKSFIFFVKKKIIRLVRLNI